MYELDLSKWNSSEQFSISNIFKKQLLLVITAVCSAIYIPLTIIHFFAGYYVICALNVLYLVVLFICTVRVHMKQHEPSIPILLILLLLLILSSTVPIYYIGITGALWGFPIITTVCFLLPPLIAFPTNSLIILCSSFFCLITLELALALRMIVSMCATFFMAGLFSHRIRIMQAQLKELSNTDPLTGVYNRRLLMELLQDSFADYQRYNIPAVIATIDLDHFKALNDTHGHDAGDKALIELIRLIRLNTRQADKVFRLGGDEILLLLRNLTDSEAREVLEKICSLINQSKDIGTTVSIGAASVRLASDAGMWMKLSDNALYNAKRGGRNQVVLS